MKVSDIYWKLTYHPEKLDFGWILFSQVDILYVKIKDVFCILELWRKMQISRPKIYSKFIHWPNTTKQQ
jgi:hypothetical protein